MNPRALLIVTAVIESATGAALVAAPSLPASLLLGSALEGVGPVVARVAGSALIALSVACWLAREAGASVAGRGVVAGLMVYDVGAAAVLVHAGLALGAHGVALWPAVGIHAGMAAWCGACLGRHAGGGHVC